MGDDLLGLHAQDRKGRRWTPGDDALLSRYAGKMSLDQVAGILHRTTESTRKRAGYLGVDHRCPAPTLMVCPVCGKWRTRLDGGMCRVCRLRENRASLEMRERGLLDRVGDAYRERSISMRQVEVVRPRCKGLGPAEVEALECALLRRGNATLRRRCERMEQWLRSHHVDSV